MNAFVFLPLQENIEQRCAGKPVPWQWYITVLVINHGIIKSFGILATVKCRWIKFDVVTLRHYFLQEVHCTLAID
jgi:hypothetical protein